MSLKKDLQYANDVIDLCRAKARAEQAERDAAPLREAIRVLVAAKARQMNETRMIIAKLDRVILSLDARLPHRIQDETPAKTGMRIKGSLMRAAKAQARYPGAHAKEVKVNFPSWVKGRKAGLPEV